MNKKVWRKPELKRMVAGAAEALSKSGVSDGGRGSSKFS